VDNDCSGAADEAWDDDLDGVSECGGDCDETDPARSPAMAEVCDGVDNDCDGEVDEGFDADGDGVSTCRGDCDDSDPRVYAGASEACDGVDNDGDESTVDDGDLDGDGWTLCGGDCDDAHASAYPGAAEVCDDLDNDCNGEVDERPDCYDCLDTTDYLICLGYADWDTARTACAAFGRDLVVLETAEENSAVATLAAGYTGQTLWVGLSDAEEEGVFRWVDGTLPGSTSWYPGEPNDSGGEDCASTNYNGLGLWNDYACSGALPFVCE
jgi:hypothetical protein